MRVAITGASGLAAAIAGALQDCPIRHVRIEDIMDCEWVWEENDVFINCAHLGFDQTKLLLQAYEAWKKDSNKYIINISSRAAEPNISQGYMYASQKASLNHLSNNLTYNSDKCCRITTINLGLLENVDVPSVTHQEVADIVKYLVRMAEYTDLEVPEMTLQHKTNYKDVQSDKQAIRDLEWLLQN
jgi:short-subunit dehydrogenase|tara:strand:+ start:825 stop:1382 length:558 start_codon:yes stop_codon:yes gene_type:complete